MKIQFIGCGKMGEIILDSILKSGISKNDIHILTSTQASASLIREKYGVNIGKNIDADLLFLAIKPQQIKEINLEKYNNKNLLIISILAGISVDTIFSMNKNISVIRCMPNLPISVGKGIIGYFSKTKVDGYNKNIFIKIFSTLGKIIEVQNEDMLDKLTALSGSGPAYYYYFTEGFKKIAIELGFSEEESSAIANNTFLGSAMMFNETGKDVSELRIQVTSKGGTTENALNTFEKEGLHNVLSKGINSAYIRSKELCK